MNTSYQITTDSESIIIRFPLASADAQDLAKLLDFLEIEAIRRRSCLDGDEAATLAAQVKEAAWQRVRPLFEAP